MSEAQTEITLDSLKAEIDVLNKKCSVLLAIALQQNEALNALAEAMDELAVVDGLEGAGIPTTKSSLVS